MNHPTVSVVVCTYNGEEFLREQLDSILAQTYPVDEILIQDDGSTDGTQPIIEEYRRKCPFLKLYHNEGEHGVNTNFFSAMQKAEGDYIAFSDQDDIWERDHLKCLVENIGESLLCSGVSEPFPEKAPDRRQPNRNLLRLLYVNSIPGHTMLIHRRLLTLIPDIQNPPNFRFYDAIIAMVAAAYDSHTFVNQVIVRHRVHRRSASFIASLKYQKSFSNAVRHIVNSFRLFAKLRQPVRQHFARQLAFLSKIQSDSPVFQEALTLLKLHSSSSFVDFIKLQLICMKHCDKLFYAQERKTPLTILRGWFFPISCHEYFRYMK